MQRHHNGSGRRVAIPGDWTSTPAAVIDSATATASTVTIGAPGGTSSWNEGLGRTITEPQNPVYVGAAELMAVSDTARAATVVEDPVKEQVYDVTLPYAASVTLAPARVIPSDVGDPDPMLAGRSLRVLAIERGSRRFSRVMLASLLD
jgi:hypothetical protein